MSFQSYITFLIKNFSRDKQVEEKQHQSSVSNNWFGLIPFLFKWFTFEGKK